MTAQRRRVAAYGVLRDGAGRVLLVPAPGGDGWALPGATVEHGERPQATVGRVLSAPAGAALAVLSDQVRRPGGVSVHHDRLVFEVLPPVGAPPAGSRWFAPADLAGVRLPGYTREVLGGVGEPAPAADLDPGWPLERGMAMDGTGPQPRVQRFSTYGRVTDRSGRFLLARIAPGYPSAGRWHLPGGGTDVGELPAEALLREVMEETGQRGRITGLVGVSHRHNPVALGREGYPIDWHTIRVVYDVTVDAPEALMVTEAAGGSTAEAAWVHAADLGHMALTDLAETVLPWGAQRPV